MIISFILPTLTLSGGVRVIFEYANRLQNRGHQVYIVAPMIPPYWWRHIKNMGLKTAIKKYFRKYHTTCKVEKDIKIIKVPCLSTSILNKVLPNGDVVIATGWETAYVVAQVREEKGRKFYFLQDIPGIHGPIDKIRETCTLGLRIITISQYLKNIIEKTCKVKIDAVIPNGIDLNKFYCNKDKDWNSNRIRILMPYRGVPWKGDFDGLKALEKVYLKYKDKVEIILYGPIKPNNLPSWVKFFENPSDDELRELYCKSHIFVGPSRVEGFYLPPMEAMACKCAVVTTNVGAVPEYTLPNKTAIVVPPRNPEKIAEGIIYLIENPAKAKKMAERGYNYIKQFTWDIAVQKMEKILAGDLS